MKKQASLTWSDPPLLLHNPLSPKPRVIQPLTNNYLEGPHFYQHTLNLRRIFVPLSY